MTLKQERASWCLAAKRGSGWGVVVGERGGNEVREVGSGQVQEGAGKICFWILLFET